MTGLCRKCGYIHRTTLEQLNCDSGGRSGKGRVEIVAPGASGSEVSEPRTGENTEKAETGSSNPLAIFNDKGSVTGSVTNYCLLPSIISCAMFCGTFS